MAPYCLTKLEQAFLKQPWAKVRDGVQVKRLATKEDVYMLAPAHIEVSPCGAASLARQGADAGA